MIRRGMYIEKAFIYINIGIWTIGNGKCINDVFNLSISLRTDIIQMKLMTSTECNVYNILI